MPGMPSNRTLHLIVIAVTALVIAAFAFSAWRDHMMTQQDAENSLSEVAQLMEEHTRAALFIGELQMARVHEILGGQVPSPSGEAPVHDTLVRLTAELPFVDSIWIFDADANIRATNYTMPPGGLNVSDRAYYQALRDGDALFVSPLIWGKLRPQPLFSISRRLNDKDGRFIGGIVISLNVGYFVDFYRSLNPAPGAVFAIYKKDGQLVMRSSLPPPNTTPQKSTAILRNLAQNASGVAVTVSEVDQVKRLYAYRRMEDRPLLVTTGLPVTQIFAEWRDRTLRNATIAALGLVAFWIIAAKLAATLEREAGLRTRAEKLLAEKEMLFQEIHHRVKNNLQIIASFLTMQAVHSRDPATADAFEEALSRLQSMGLVHQILYEQNEATEVSMDAYLQALGTTIGQTFGAEARGIHIEVTPSDTRLAMDQAVPLALFANEALTNALKHAFPDGKHGSIRMGLNRQPGALAFSLADDGIGMPDGARPGLGMTILSALARQLDGNMDWSTGSGTRLTLTMPA